jgi:2-polyprenyl-3-methyl-5-hydroxy-6-metoxy-1,4-benzoquinol methylase
MQNICDKAYQNQGNEDVLTFLTQPGTVLDIGCGVGDNAKFLSERGYQVDGITISKHELEAASHFLNKGFLFNLEYGLPEEIKNQRYDYVICSHVLEHICYPTRLLADVKGCLKENGVMVVALPNLFHYSSRWKLACGEFDYQNAGLWDNTHFKWYTYRTGRSLLENNGFKVVFAGVTGELPGNSLFSKFLSKQISDRIFDQLKKISPGLFGYQLLYVATI